MFRQSPSTARTLRLVSSRSRRRWWAGLSGLTLALVTSLPLVFVGDAPAGAAGQSTFNFIATGINGPTGITTGPDGAMWFTNRTNESIGRITTTGTVSNFSRKLIRHPDQIVTGSDGALWYTSVDNSIGRITTAGVVTTFTGPGVSRPSGIVAGPDGAVWFTNSTGNSIGRITPSGTISITTDPSIAQPQRITLGADGALWFTNTAQGRYSIGRITTSGVVSAFTDASIVNPAGIATGADGNVWFVDNYRTVSRITPTGTVTAFSLPDPQTIGGSIAAGPDGSLWFNTLYGRIGRITTTGTVTIFPDFQINCSTGYYKCAMTGGPDGAVWFTNYSSNSIGRVSATDSVTIYGGAVRPSGPMISGPDGALWFANGGTIGRLTTDGTVTNYPIPSASKIAGIATGPDGKIWFTNSNGDTTGDFIGRMATDGSVTEFKDPSLSGPNGITVGPDGALWFTNYGNLSLGYPETPSTSSIGRITTSGTISAFKGVADLATGITAGPDGALWFTNGGINIFKGPVGGGAIAESTLSGTQTVRYGPTGAVLMGSLTLGSDGAIWAPVWAPAPYWAPPGTSWIERIGSSGTQTKFLIAEGVDLGNAQGGIITGPDGAIWFTSSGNIERITPDGAIVRYPHTSPTISATALCAGPDGNVWFVDQYNSRIGNVRVPNGTISNFSPGSGTVGSSVTVRGFGLEGATAVLINGVAATITKDTPTKLKFTVAPGTTSGVIQIITARGTTYSSTPYTVN